MSCCSHLCSELKNPLFSVEEPPKGRLDLNAHFHVGQGVKSKVGITKLITFCISIAVLVYAFYKNPEPSFYAAYLTPWGVFFCIWYLGASFCVTACGFADNSTRERATVLVKFAWFFYSVAAVLGCCIAGLYWTAVWTPARGVELNNVMTHGGLLVIVLLQGLFVDRVPLRIKHNLFGTAPIALAYNIWLAIQNLAVKYNPNQDDDDDALYDAVKWRENPTGAIILTIIVLFVAIPFFTMLLWLLSLPGRRYLDDGNDYDDGDDDSKSPDTHNEYDAGDEMP
ncbi:unnamed protein product [Cylindrotheca closterium]|uniref:Uncharacterized protein n=1 Tax=Cylindrotheca closterium TaxID=2856 RepID=A0AAD2CC97_9STRA|nr:unnamed protein product [Cylindrotheca closterium]